MTKDCSNCVGCAECATDWRESDADFAGKYRCMFNITSGIPCHFAAAYRLPSGSLACEVCAARNGGGVEI